MNQRSVIFLDLDGVLVRWDDATFDTACVRRLNDLVESTGAAVVVSSSWRETQSVNDLTAALCDAGFVGEVVGVTPVLPGASRAKRSALGSRA